MPEADLALLLRTAHAAGEIAHRYWRRAPEAWEKPGGEGPVSVADLAVNAMLRETLLAARPDYGWLSEESPDDPAARGACTRVFLLDPIDGTRAFLAGSPDYAHSLAVVERGEVIAAVVHLPEIGLTYSATATGPALLNGAAITPATTLRAADAVVLAPSSVQRSEHWRGGAAPGFRVAFRASLAWRLCLVAEGKFDAALSLRPAWEWDIAAGALIAARAGALLSDRHGAAVRFNQPVPQSSGLLVAPPGLHADLLGALSTQAANDGRAP
ncbi:MAG: 3'(2'),5'-bisphosphate nucleotidase CysQ [Alphaproteobacteria bacterium HGW-Alphaproteobacteria-4]|nr:MAG: 3'(2'),5'-bisphosphate nucleotidase CysQ [Alphaproteobacteria bacterium HGW-Alphaproteobacteria-4]